MYGDDSMREKLLKLREECRSREFCKGCRHELADCVLYDGEENQFYVSDWSDGFVDWLASELERPKAKLIRTLETAQLWRCSQCGAVATYRERYVWKYCPNCGAEMEDD